MAISSSHRKERVFTLLGGSLLTPALMLVAFIPKPVTTDLAGWIRDNSTLFMLSNELCFFGVVLLTTALVMRHTGLSSTESSASKSLALTSGYLASVALLCVVIAEGRLAYALPGMALDQATLTFAVSLFYGALHTALLLVALGLFALWWATRQSASLATQLSLVGAAVLQIVAAYPWSISTGFKVLAAASLVAALTAICSLTTPTPHKS